MGHWKGEGRRELLVREVLDEFSFLHSDVEVQLTFASDLMPGTYQKGAAELIAGMIRNGEYTFDVIWLDPLTYTNYVAEDLGDPDWGRKYLVDFSTVPGFSGNAETVSDGKVPMRTAIREGYARGPT